MPLNQTHGFKRLFIIGLFGMLSACQPQESGNHYANQPYLNFPTTLSPDTPYDVDIDLEKKLLNEKKFDEIQRLFDILAWQMFISLNWPRAENGEPKPNISDPGKRSWESWEESFEIFKADGSAPLPWGPSQEVPSPIRVVSNLKNPIEETKILFRGNKAGAFHGMTAERDSADEINQAFTSPIWDQNGNIVRYEIRLNKVMTDYIVRNELYNLDGQIAFSKAGKQVSFPVSTREKPGVLEVKAAWKIMNPEKDILERYYTTEAYVIDKNQKFTKKTVGLVGMHISTKSQSSPQWVWATFEHIDNLETNPLKKVNGRNVHPSFYDPACSTCPINTIPDTNQTLIKNQIQRILPIPPATQELNKQVQSLLAQKGSFWQYYQLIGSQWPTAPKAKPYYTPKLVPGSDTIYSDTTKYILPEAVTNKPGGKPTPTYLTNMVMETYFQGATTLPHYNLALANEAAYFQIQHFPKGLDTANTSRLIFGTEGCMGCHFGAGIAVGDFIDKSTKQRRAIVGSPGTADFEWLLQLKAHFKTEKPKVTLN